jgi:hypothetical protein
MVHGMNDPLQQTTCSGGAVDSPYHASAAKTRTSCAENLQARCYIFIYIRKYIYVAIHALASMFD